jgi:hypothetical protein
MNETGCSFGEGKAIEDAINAMQRTDSDAADIGHALCCKGLAHLRGNICSACLIDELLFVRNFIDATLSESRAEVLN